MFHFIKGKKKEKKSGLINRQCERTKKRRDEAWKRMKRKPIQKRKEEYKLEIN